MASDYYKMLGLKRNASAKQIRRAFLMLSKQEHPDVVPRNYPGWEERATRRFQDINEAYVVLKDPLTKRDYDRQLEEEVTQREETPIVRTQKVDASYAPGRHPFAKSKRDPDFHWAVPRDEPKGFFGFIKIYFKALSMYNQFGFLLLLLAFIIYFLNFFPLMFRTVFP